MLAAHGDSASPSGLSSSRIIFRDEVGVDLGGHCSAHQRFHGDAAVNVLFHKCMAAMLIALLTPRLLT